MRRGWWRPGKRRPLHEATQRAWCRLAFLLCGALPVLFIGMLCAAEYFPSYQHARRLRYQQSLSQMTGLSIEVDRVELLAPNRRTLHGVKLHHPETGELMASLPVLWISETPSGCALHGPKPVIQAEHLSSLYRLIHEQVLCRPTAMPHAMVVWLDGLTIEGTTDQRVVFDQLHCELKRQALTTEAAMTFDLAGVSGQRARLGFARHHADAQPTSRWTLSTGGQYLPGHWVNALASDFSVPGDSASFTGQFELAHNQSTWNLRGAGRMHEVDAATWFERPVLSGTADVEVTGFAMNDRGLKHANGRLSIRDGRIHADLITAAIDIGISRSQTLGVNPNAPLTKNIIHPFTQLAAGFELDAQGLRITPLLPDKAVVQDPMGPLAVYCIVVDNYDIPVKNLLIALARATLPQSTPDVLNSPTARRLVQWLPGPIVPTPSDQTLHQVSQ
ncbi:MAG: hypothetical protein IT423_10890 [Pirellulaceae bacterium]|nr:hypothetical protein [Pirellulaceae bacterium]